MPSARCYARRNSLTSRWANFRPPVQRSTRRAPYAWDSDLKALCGSRGTIRRVNETSPDGTV